jgi:hypothetical protein
MLPCSSGTQHEFSYFSYNNGKLCNWWKFITYKTLKQECVKTICIWTQWVRTVKRYSNNYILLLWPHCFNSSQSSLTITAVLNWNVNLCSIFYLNQGNILQQYSTKPSVYLYNMVTITCFCFACIMFWCIMLPKLNKFTYCSVWHLCCYTCSNYWNSKPSNVTDLME